MMAESCLVASKMASRSRRLQSEWKDDQHIDWCRSRLRYMSGRSPLEIGNEAFRASKNIKGKMEVGTIRLHIKRV